MLVPRSSVMESVAAIINLGKAVRCQVNKISDPVFGRIFPVLSGIMSHPQQPTGNARRSPGVLKVPLRRNVASRRYGASPFSWISGSALLGSAGGTTLILMCSPARSIANRTTASVGQAIAKVQGCITRLFP